MRPDEVESYRALLPRGFAHAAACYREAAATLTARDLSDHYTAGLTEFHEVLVPHVKDVLARLTGGVWDLSGWRAFAAGSDVDFIAHVIDASADPVAVYPGDWGGFYVGPTNRRVQFTRDARGALACLCLPSVRNGQLTDDMVQFLGESKANLLNVNLFPTLAPAERADVARALLPVLDRTLLSVSFSRGFALTASQLGVLLVPPGHPLLALKSHWDWYTFFYNAIAARAFMKIRLDEVERVNDLRRAEVRDWHARHGMPWTGTGSYYVKTFRVDGALPAAYRPLERDGCVRLCFKPEAE